MADIASQGLDAKTVTGVVRRVKRNEYKRRQAAPGVRISQRAFGRDRRYPIPSAFGKNRDKVAVIAACGSRHAVPNLLE